MTWHWLPALTVALALASHAHAASFTEAQLLERIDAFYDAFQLDSVDALLPFFKEDAVFEIIGKDRAAGRADIADLLGPYFERSAAFVPFRVGAYGVHRDDRRVTVSVKYHASGVRPAVKGRGKGKVCQAVVSAVDEFVLGDDGLVAEWTSFHDMRDVDLEAELECQQRPTPDPEKEGELPSYLRVDKMYDLDLNLKQRALKKSVKLFAKTAEVELVGYKTFKGKEIVSAMKTFLQTIEQPLSTYIDVYAPDFGELVTALQRTVVLTTHDGCVSRFTSWERYEFNAKGRISKLRVMPSKPVQEIMDELSDCPGVRDHDEL